MLFLKFRSSEENGNGAKIIVSVFHRDIIWQDLYGMLVYMMYVKNVDKIK